MSAVTSGRTPSPCLPMRSRRKQANDGFLTCHGDECPLSNHYNIPMMGTIMGSMIEYPFGPAIPEIILGEPPLALVVAQLQFPAILSIAEGGSFSGPFQEALREDYPVLRRQD